LVWRTIIEEIGVPKHLAELLLHSLKEELLIYPNGMKVMKKSGQLMGSLTSFPALCIINDAICEYSNMNARKINGDDVIAFASLESKKHLVKECVEMWYVREF